MVALPMTLCACYQRQNTPFSAFCIAIHSFVTGEPRDAAYTTSHWLSLDFSSFVSYYLLLVPRFINNVPICR